MRILIVDDDIPTLQAIKESVDWNLFPVEDVYTANNIIKARSLIEKFTPEIIICDIEMPKGSGIDLIKWVRENNFDSRFLFLTCHEEFIYASEAIKYEADAYITKPFEVNKLQISIAKAVEKITYKREMKDNGARWINDSYRREKNFWRDLLFNDISRDKRTIKNEIDSRGVSINAEASYRLMLGSVREPQPEEKGWDGATFRYALGNMASEIMTGSVDAVRTIDYYIMGRYLVATIIPCDEDKMLVDENCKKLIDMCKRYLQCDMTCYIGKKITIENLPETRLLLEEADACNIKKRNMVIHVCTEGLVHNTEYSFDSSVIEALLGQERSVEAVNILRRELEELEAKGKLNREIMRSIQHDYMQIIYSILYRNDVQAHELFSDAPSKKLFQSSDSSVFEMMKWASYVTAKTFQYIKETRKAETIVDRLKRFMAENYTKRLTRDDIASNVYLSPDYVSKIFHNETGMYLKDYLNELRIGKAKQLLAEGKFNVSEIASIIGFDNFSYFSTLFKKSVGVSPSEYKKMGE